MSTLQLCARRVLSVYSSHTEQLISAIVSLCELPAFPLLLSEVLECWQLSNTLPTKTSHAVLASYLQISAKRLCQEDFGVSVTDQEFFFRITGIPASLCM